MRTVGGKNRCTRILVPYQNCFTLYLDCVRLFLKTFELGSGFADKEILRQRFYTIVFDGGFL